MSVLRVVGGGVFRVVCGPVYGGQDVGVSPGGPLDRVSMVMGNVALGNEGFARALEVVFVGALEFEEDVLFVLTGAGRGGAFLERRGFLEGVVEVGHGVVSFARRGDRLVLGAADYGFRTYVCFVVCGGEGLSGVDGGLVGRVIPRYDVLFGEGGAGGGVRVVEGPECGCLVRGSDFLDRGWVCSAEMSDMGIRLEGGALEVEGVEMVSVPVSDGTVQLTPRGPVVLLRMRQTVGGYPRVFNVIGADVDLLGQFGPGEVMRFRLVSLEEAVAVGLRRREALEGFRRGWLDEGGEGHLAF